MKILFWNQIGVIFDLQKLLKMKLGRRQQAKQAKRTLTRTPEIGSGLVRVSHKISSDRSSNQLVKIGEKYFKVRELG